MHKNMKTGHSTGFENGEEKRSIHVHVIINVQLQ